MTSRRPVSKAPVDDSGGQFAASNERRLVELESAVNFRDIGGYPTAAGSVRWGRVYRSDNLSRLTVSDARRIRELGIVSVLDLRTTTELEESRFPTEEIPVGFHHFPLLDEIPDPDRFRMAPGMLGNQYVEMAEQAASNIGEAIQLFAKKETQPAVIHCAAGKDRTGVLVAVLLGLLGVERDVIVADYAMSGEAMGRLRHSLMERYPEGVDVIRGADELFSAAPSNIVRLLDWIDHKHGSMERYAETTGVSPQVVRSLRENLIET